MKELELENFNIPSNKSGVTSGHGTSLPVAGVRLAPLGHQ